MKPRKEETGRAANNGSKPHLAPAPLPVAATRVPGLDDIDAALDGLVTTVDDLVRDLATEDVESDPFSYAHSAESPDTVDLVTRLRATTGSAKKHTARNVALMVAGLLFVVVFEYLVLALLLPSS